jgi:heavy metal sensor kinase
VIEVGVEDEAGETLDSLMVILSMAVPATLVIASAGGIFLAGRALTPIDTITRAARRISSGNLSHRVDVGRSADEVGRLAQTFNDMLARLEQAFQREQELTADISHELRTPLTAIRGQVEVALRHEREAGDYQRVLHAVNADVDRLIRLVSGLLLLARADSGQVQLTLEQVSVSTLMHDAAEQVRPRAERGGIVLVLDGGTDVVVGGDRDLLLQLLLNLLDNALKHTEAGGTVSMSWRQQADTLQLVVADTGTGISVEDQAHVFERFYRASRARSGHDGGAGLGLSLCDWIARAHGGTVHVESTPGEGSTFTVALPVGRS